jgi:hypothetical protein
MIGHPLLFFSNGAVDAGREVLLRSIVVADNVGRRLASFAELLEKSDALEDGVG